MPPTFNQNNPRLFCDKPHKFQAYFQLDVIKVVPPQNCGLAFNLAHIYILKNKYMASATGDIKEIIISVPITDPIISYIIFYSQRI